MAHRKHKPGRSMFLICTIYEGSTTAMFLVLKERKYQMEMQSQRFRAEQHQITVHSLRGD